MKNLKKVLALALAIALSLTMFAGAAFTDQEEINKTEAVDTLVALGVINGMPDGSFNPDGNVTRAEMAKMIYAVRMRGNTDAGNFAGLSTSFTDLYDTWYRGYVKWAQAAGIIDGKSATTFDPNGSVTGTEAAKMLLVLAGYTSDRAGLTGVNWETNTIRYASQAGLLDNMDNVDLSQALPREYAAQLIYNALFTTMVRWSNDSNSFVDLEEKTTSASGAVVNYVTTIGIKYMDLREVTAEYLGNYATNVASKKGYIRLAGVANEIEYDLNTDWLYEDVTVLYQDNNIKGTLGQLDENDQIYGVTNARTTTVYNTTADQLKDIYKTDATTAEVKFGGVNYDVDSDLTGVINSGAGTIKYDSTTNSTSAAKKFYDAYNGNLNTAIKFVCNDDGEIAKVVVSSVTGYADIVSLSADKITVRGMDGGTKDIEDDNVVLYDGAAQGDIVYYYTQYASGRGQEIVVEKASTITGQVTGITNGTTITVDGNTYKQSKLVATNINEYGTNIQVGDTYTFVMDGNYWVAAKAVSESSNYAMVIASEKGNINGMTVKLLLADGTTTVVKVHEDSTYPGANAIDIPTTDHPALVTYTMTDDGVKLTQVATPTATTGTSYNNDTKTLTIDSKSYLTDSNAVAFICTDLTKNTWKVYSADDLSSYTNASGTAYAAVKNNKIAAYSLELGKTPSGVASGDLIGYVVDDGTLVIDGNDFYFNYTVWDGEQNVTVRGAATNKNDASSTCTALRKGNFIKITDFDATKAYGVSDNIQLTVKADPNSVDGSASVNAGATLTVKTKSLERGLLIMTTKKWDAAEKPVAGEDFAVKLADNYKIIGVNTEDQEGVAGATVTSFNDIYQSDFANAIVILNGDKEATHIFVDVNNKISTAK